MYLEYCYQYDKWMEECQRVVAKYDGNQGVEIGFLRQSYKIACEKIHTQAKEIEQLEAKIIKLETAIDELDIAIR
jgi:hypothetical protein